MNSEDESILFLHQLSQLSQAATQPVGSQDARAQRKKWYRAAHNSERNVTSLFTTLRAHASLGFRRVDERPGARALARARRGERGWVDDEGAGRATRSGGDEASRCNSRAVRAGLLFVARKELRRYSSGPKEPEDIDSSRF